MSNIDSELNLLKQRMAVLEEQKRIEAEKEAEKKINPMKILGEILDKKKNHPTPQVVGKQVVGMSRETYNMIIDELDKASFLEPIFNMLKSINERLDLLENKKKENSIETLF
jgi:FKBP-type peptidyl-prolyl cis-trans isomerase (trigger factor)